MNQEEEKRVKVSAVLDAEICQAEIARIAGVGIRSVHHITAAKRSGTFSAKRKHGSGSYQSVSTQEFIKATSSQTQTCLCASMLERWLSVTSQFARPYESMGSRVLFTTNST